MPLADNFLHFLAIQYGTPVCSPSAPLHNTLLSCMQTLEISATGKKKGRPLGKKDGPHPLGAKKHGHPPKKQVDSGGKNTLIEAEIASNRLIKETVPVLGGNDDDGYWGDFDDHEGFY